MKYIRYIAAESLRMYPEPPLLIRRALESDELPPGAGGPDGLRPKITRGVDLFLAIYNVHRSKDFWENPDTFDPDRFDRPFQNKGVEGWAGFNPELLQGQMYPNEVASDFAYLPFGGEGATAVVAVVSVGAVRAPCSGFVFGVCVRRDFAG